MKILFVALLLSCQEEGDYATTKQEPVECDYQNPALLNCGDFDPYNLKLTSRKQFCSCSQPTADSSPQPEASSSPTGVDPDQLVTPSRPISNLLEIPGMLTELGGGLSIDQVAPDARATIDFTFRPLAHSDTSPQSFLPFCYIVGSCKGLDLDISDIEWGREKENRTKANDRYNRAQTKELMKIFNELNLNIRRTFNEWSDQNKPQVQSPPSGVGNSIDISAEASQPDFGQQAGLENIQEASAMVGQQLDAIERAIVRQTEDGIEVDGLAGVALGRKPTTSNFVIEIELDGDYERAVFYANGLPGIDLTQHKPYQQFRIEIRATANRYDIYENYYDSHLDSGALWPHGYYPALIKWGPLGVLLEDGKLKRADYAPLLE